MPAPVKNCTLFCPATLLLSCLLPCELPLMPPSVSYAAGEDTASHIFMSRQSPAWAAAEEAAGPLFQLKSTQHLPGELCRSCSSKPQSSRPVQITKKGQAPFQMPEKAALPHAAYKGSSTAADEPLAVPLADGDTGNASDAATETAALQTSKAAQMPEEMVSEELAQKLLLLVLPDAGKKPHPVSLAYTPADTTEKILLSGGTSAMRPVMPEEDRRQKERQAGSPCSMKDMAAVLHILYSGRAVTEDDVLSLLGSAPGVLLMASSEYAGDAAGKGKQAEGSAETARQLLIVITEPDCLFCRQAQRYLTGRKLPFPVLFLPAGSSVSARNFYEKALLHAGSAAADADSRRDAVSAWLAKTEDWLMQKSGTGTVSLPAFIWIADGTARMRNLSSKALQCLVAAMTWRYERMMLHAGRETAQVAQ